MITLVITIVVVIILAGIALITSNSTTGQATHAKYGHELSEIEDKVRSKRIENSLKAPGELIKNKGFTKVYIENPPDDFVSFDEDAITGYWVNMDTIQENEITTGHEQLTEMRVKFSVQDVYVYDASGKVYYVKGWYDGEDNLHYRLDSIETGEDPEIVSAEYVLSGDKKQATIKVVAKPSNGGTLTVTIGGIAITPSAENTYETVVNDNGMIMVVAKESTGGTASQTITVEGIEKEKDTTAPEITLNSKVNGKVVTIEGSIRDDESNITGYKFTKAAEEPTDWVSVNSVSASATYRAEERGIYYLWAKNKEGLVASKSITVTVPNVYEITYDANGGSGAPASQEKIENQSTTLSNDVPNREGYTFEGWSTNGVSGTVSYRPGDVYTSNNNLNLYAVWKVKTYTITYNANGGTGAPGSETKVFGETKTISNIRPERTGYEFLGWSTSESSTVASYQPGAEYVGNANLDLYAVWKAEPRKYTVTYNANGGSLGSVVASQIKTEDISMTIDRNSPVREGYVFQGWGTSATETTASYQPGETYASNADLDLYAIWKANTYTVKYNANGGTLGDVPSSQTKTHDKSLILDINVPSRDGYIFGGWATTADSITANYQPGGTLVENANIELYAVWQLKTYTIKYNANGGNLDNVPSTQVKTHDVVAVLDLNKPTRTNYVFKGWDTVATSTTASYQPGGSYAGNADLELYAVWELKTYTITYNANGGSLDKVASIQIKTHDVVATLDNNTPVRTGYTFKGWGTTSSATTATYQPGGRYTGNADVELFAVWTIDTYTITYNANGGSLDKVPASETKTYGVAYTINANAPVRTGYTFKGWGTTASSTTASYQPGVQYTGNANLELFAIWEVNTYTITYNANGGSLDKVPATQTKKYSETINLDTNVPVRDGFVFIGWSSNSGATVGSYEAGAPYTANANVTLYAVWEEEVIYTLSGTWLFNEKLILPNENMFENVSFFANDGFSTYTFEIYNSEVTFYGKYSGALGSTDNPHIAYYEGSWVSYDSRIITFGEYPNVEEQQVSKEFYEWFIANATEYEAPSVFYIEGTEYTFTLGDTWANWRETNDSYDGCLDMTPVYDGPVYWGGGTQLYDTKGNVVSYYDMIIAGEHYSHNPIGYYTFTFKIDGEQYTAEDGMTWEEWLVSDYNTTGETAPTIRDSNLKIVEYDRTILSSEEYSFETYELSGTWKFNDTINLPNTTLEQDIDGYYLSPMNNQMSIINIQATSSAIDYDRNLMYSSSGWENENNRVVIFNGEQEVSKAFYEWFTANAKEQVPISGVWKFNDVVDVYGGLMSFGEEFDEIIYYSQEVSYTAGRFSYIYMSLDYTPDVYTLFFDAEDISDPVFRTDFSGNNWLWQESKVVDFGTEQQLVQKEFYEWFIANAVQVEMHTITYDANGGSLENVPATQTMVEGVETALDSNKPVRTDYLFKGWSTNKNATTGSYMPEDAYTANADVTLYAIWESGKVVDVDGLGDVEVNDPNAELTYDPDDGELGGVVPPVEEVPEVPEEIPEEVLPTIIEFGYGDFESVTNYTPGTYETVPYETTYTRTKYPVSYYNVVWSEWSITKDAEGNITKTEPGDMQLGDIGEQYSTYIVYDFETTEALESNGVKGDSVELWTIYFDTEDSLENAVYLAAYLNKLDGKTSRHIAKWDGSKYVAYNADADISAINTFVETYTVTGTKQVQITAPSSSTEYVYVPVGTLKAEEGMTWAEWLTSEYNTTGQTSPTIKTSDFADVTYSDVIVAGEEYGFIIYEISGIWEFNVNSVPSSEIVEDINYNIEDFTSYSFDQIRITSSGIIVRFSDGTLRSMLYDGNWYCSPIFDFGTTPQPVSKEFYEWFTANAKQYTLSGTWEFVERPEVFENNLIQKIKFYLESSDTHYSHICVGNEYNLLYNGDADEDTYIGFQLDNEIYTHLNAELWTTYYEISYAEVMNEYFYDWYSYDPPILSFGSTPQPVSKEFYDWFTANATEVEKKKMTIYSSTENYESIELPGDEFYFNYYEGDTWNDVINRAATNSVTNNGDSSIGAFYAGSEGYVTYNSTNNTIEPLEVGYTYVTSDETISDDYKYEMYRETGGAYHVIKIAKPDIITFTIYNVQYEAEDGMTWEEFIESDYAPTTEDEYWFEIINYCVAYRDEDGVTYVHISTSSESAEKITDTIVAGNAYVLYTSQGPYGDGHSGGSND